MNDPIILESSRVYAERLMEEQSTPGEKIEKAFRSIVCRQPKKEELVILLNYFNDEEKLLDQSKEKARQLIEVGEYPHAKIDHAGALAALMQVIHTIYNLEESITKT